MIFYANKLLVKFIVSRRTIFLRYKRHFRRTIEVLRVTKKGGGLRRVFLQKQGRIPVDFSSMCTPAIYLAQTWQMLARETIRKASNKWVFNVLRDVRTRMQRVVERNTIFLLVGRASPSIIRTRKDLK
jgi:hypothetical protein